MSQGPLDFDNFDKIIGPVKPQKSMLHRMIVGAIWGFALNYFFGKYLWFRVLVAAWTTLFVSGVVGLTAMLVVVFIVSLATPYTSTPMSTPLMLVCVIPGLVAFALMFRWMWPRLYNGYARKRTRPRS